MIGLSYFLCISHITCIDLSYFLCISADSYLVYFLISHLLIISITIGLIPLSSPPN